MITCKRATELISKSLDEPLTTGERLSLRLHLFLCEFCEQFRKQCELLRQLLGPQATKQGDESSETELSPTEKEALKTKIRTKFENRLR